MKDVTSLLQDISQSAGAVLDCWTDAGLNGSEDSDGAEFAAAVAQFVKLAPPVLDLLVTMEQTVDGVAARMQARQRREVISTTPAYL